MGEGERSLSIDTIAVGALSPALPSFYYFFLRIHYSVLTVKPRFENEIVLTRKKKENNLVKNLLRLYFLS